MIHLFLYRNQDECVAFLLSWTTSSENCVRSANDVFMQVSFQWKNPDFLLRNPDFLLKNDDFII